MALVEMKVMYRKPRKVATDNPKVREGDSVEVWNWKLSTWEFVLALSNAKSSRVNTTKGWASFIKGQERGEGDQWYLEDPPGPSPY